MLYAQVVRLSALILLFTGWVCMTADVAVAQSPASENRPAESPKPGGPPRAKPPGPPPHHAEGEIKERLERTEERLERLTDEVHRLAQLLARDQSDTPRAKPAPKPEHPQGGPPSPKAKPADAKKPPHPKPAGGPPHAAPANKGAPPPHEQILAEIRQLRQAIERMGGAAPRKHGPDAKAQPKAGKPRPKHPPAKPDAPKHGKAHRD